MFLIFEKYFLSALFVVSIAFSLNTYAQHFGFEIYMETEYDEIPTQFRLDNEGNFIGLVRKAPPSDTGYIYDTYLYKISALGDTMSNKYEKEDTLYTFFYIDRLLSEPTGFLLTGWGYKIGEDPSHPFTILRRIDDDLDLVWEKTFFFNYFYGAYRSALMELTNGNILYACSPHLSANMFLFKISSQGDSLNYLSYTGTEAGEVYDLTYSPDSSNIWLHNKWAHYQGSGNSLSSCIVINNKLEQIDVKHYPENFVPPFNSIVYNDSTLLSGGSDWIPIIYEGSENMIVSYLLDTSFNIKHEVHLTHPDTNSRGAESQCIDYYYPNCIYLGGNHNLQGLISLEPSWIYIAKLNDTLGVVYEKYIGGDNNYLLYSVTAAADGGVLLAGTRQEVSIEFLTRDGFILKLDSLGCITGLSENTNIKITDAMIYPNPGSGVINIRTALNGCTFHLFDAWGRQIAVKQLSGRITTMSTTKLKKGNYYYSVMQNNKTIISGTWIKN